MSAAPGYLSAQAGLTQTANLALNWAIPILAILAAVKYTRACTAPARESA